MPYHPIDNAKKLQKLGERIRDGFAKENPIPDKSLETVRNAVREQWDQERKAKSQQPAAPAPAKERTKDSLEPDREL